MTELADLETVITRDLDKLARLRAQNESDHQQLYGEQLDLLTPEQRRRWDEIETAKAILDGEYAKATAPLENGIREYTLQLGHTVNGEVLQAVYNQPRETWNGAKLNGYAAAHPEILAFKTTGAASTIIRRRERKAKP